ncbi:MAG: hypothetical protein M1820_008016 [Bogoriella megaspora]|nr:MAG: hypothetical protein M1820_008016 [Bogoriella megaspora]
MPTLKTYHGVYIWKYIPSLPLAVTFAILFLLTTLVHGYKIFKTKTWFCLPFVLGGILEVIGYICRALATNNTGSLTPYILQAIFLLLPPILFAASLYMLYSRIVRAVNGSRFSLTSPRYTTRIFVLSDWASLNIQSGGGGLLANPKHERIGTWIIIGGLAIQIGMFVVFMAYCVSFNIRFRRYVGEMGGSVGEGTPWQGMLNLLYVMSGIVLVRNVYRVVEFVMGQSGYLFSVEWPTYVFDGALMLVVMIGVLIWYPSQLRPNIGDEMIELTAEEGSTAEHGHLMKTSH